MNQKGLGLVLIVSAFALTTVLSALFYIIYVKSTAVPMQANQNNEMGAALLYSAPSSSSNPLPTPYKVSPKSNSFTLADVKQLANKFSWEEPLNSGRMEFNDYGKIFGSTVAGTFVIKSGSESFNEQISLLRNDEYWLAGGWRDDILQAADGVTGSAWGYYRDEGNKRQIINFHYDMDRADAERMFQARESLTEFSCPCEYNINVFLSEWFD